MVVASYIRTPEEKHTPSYGQDEFFESCKQEIEKDKQDTTEWAENQDKWHRLRMRIKKSKSFPFTGCANLRLPTIETFLRKQKAGLVKIVFGTRPVAQAIPTPSGNMQIAQKIEKFLDHLIMDVIQLKPKGVIAIDQSQEKGFYLLKPYWRKDITTRVEEYNIDDLEREEARWVYHPSTHPDQIKQILIERLDVDMSDDVAEQNDMALTKAIGQVVSGHDSIRIELQDVVYNAPDVALLNPEYFYVPSDSRYHPQDLRRGSIEFFLPLDTVKRNVEIKGWSAEAVAKIQAMGNLDPKKTTELTKETREGITRLNNPSNLVRIYETYKYYDINNDGFEEKCIFTFAPDFGLTLRKIALDISSNKWPIVKIVNELIDDRWFSHRGMPELIEDLVKEIDTQHNQKLDSQTLRNAPMISYRAGVVNPNLIKFQPAQAIPRHEADDITMLNNTNLNVDFSYEKEQMILETKVSELVGQNDFSLQSMINKRQPRTAFEVSKQEQNMQMVFSLDSEIYADAFSELFSYIWDLWCQYGSDEYEFAYFGENGWEKIKLTKEEIQGKYKIVIRGNDQNFNPQIRQEKASLIMQATLNPVAIQMGLIQPNNVYNAYKNYYQQLNVNGWEELVTNPQMLPPPQKPPAPIQLGPENLTPAELAQVKQEQGISPDILGMAIQKHEEMSNAEADREVKRKPSTGPSAKREVSESFE